MLSKKINIVKKIAEILLDTAKKIGVELSVHVSSPES
jgi:hypothetical protein